MFSSNTWTLPEDVEIFFTDSGPPPGSANYTTVIILHGSTFNGHSFEHLHALAHPNNLRTVIWNLREYSGSSKYTDSEMEALQNGRQEFLDRIGVQLAHFMEQFIAKEKVPRISPEKKGGFAILGWSLGTITAMSLFSHSRLLTPESYNLLASYIKDLVLYDPPYFAFGYQPPEYSYAFNPVSNPSLAATIATLSPEESFTFFCKFVASYYDHPNLSGDSDTAADFDTRLGTDKVTTASWTLEQVSKYYETFPLRSEHLWFNPQMQQTLNNLTNCVLFSEEVAKTAFPDLRVSYLACTQSNWGTVWSGLETKRLYKECEKHARKINFITLEGCNHFAYYDKPDEFMTKLVQALEA